MSKSTEYESNFQAAILMILTSKTAVTDTKYWQSKSEEN